jgi:hypothetical protein
VYLSGIKVCIGITLPGDNAETNLFKPAILACPDVWICLSQILFWSNHFARYQKILFPNNLPIESIRTLRLQGNLPLSNQPDEQAGTAGLTVLTLL